MKITQSRNKLEGFYVGRTHGYHYRSGKMPIAKMFKKVRTSEWASWMVDRDDSPHSKNFSKHKK